MAAAHTDRADNDSKKGQFHSLILSKYAESLESQVKQRYKEKIAFIGVDPLIIPENKLSSECFPLVESCDLLSYLYTNAQFKNFRSLQVYSQMVSAFITSILGQIMCDKHVVIAKVRHSQRTNDPHVQLWIIANKDGTMISEHCARCMTGLGECCSHIASVLFYIEVWTRLNNRVHITNTMKKLI